MGGCFSLQRPDLTGNTFSHYSLSSQEENIDLYPGFRYVETEASVCEDSVWRRSSVPLLDNRPEDSVSISSSLSQCHTLSSQVCEELDRGSPDRVSPPSTEVIRSSPHSTQPRDKRAFFWNKALVRLRKSFLRRSNKISSESSLPSHSGANENPACVRHSTSTSAEEEFA